MTALQTHALSLIAQLPTGRSHEHAPVMVKQGSLFCRPRSMAFYAFTTC